MQEGLIYRLANRRPPDVRNGDVCMAWTLGRAFGYKLQLCAFLYTDEPDDFPVLQHSHLWLVIKGKAMFRTYLRARFARAPALRYFGAGTALNVLLVLPKVLKDQTLYLPRWMDSRDVERGPHCHVWMLGITR